MSKADIQPDFQFPRPTSPRKTDLSPNAHPYAIVTSSTALLSRSHSSHRQQQHHANTRSHYVPPSPQSPPIIRRNSHSKTAGQRHHYSNSMNNDQPRPLPTPPSASPSPTKEMSEDQLNFPRRSKRAEALPSRPAVPSEDLPPNPKLWTPSQLATYLSTALRVKSGESMVLPPPIVSDIAFFVRDKRIGGRTFLHLTDGELQEYGLNKLWTDALLDASHCLRQNVLKGKIWGFSDDHSRDAFTSPAGSPAPEAEDDDDTPNRSQYQAGTYRRARGHSSSSSVSSTDSLNESPTRKAGRVRNMARTFDRSGSFDADDIAPYRSSRMGRRQSISSTGSTENQLFESAVEGGESSGGEEHKTLSRPLPVPPAHSPLFVSPPTETVGLPAEEPTMEELLANEPKQPKNTKLKAPMTISRKAGRKGVQAWEEDEGLGIVTVKRLPTSSSSGSDSFGKKVGDLFVDLTEEPEPTLRQKDSSPPPGLLEQMSEPERKLVAEEKPLVDEKLASEEKLAMAEKALKAESDDARSILRALETRLTALEDTISDMEKRESMLEKERNAPIHVPPVPSGPLVRPPTTFLSAMTKYLGYGSGSEDYSKDLNPAPKRKRTVQEIWDPKTISELPPYILLVGIGVVAVVLKVVLKRGPPGR